MYIPIIISHMTKYELKVMKCQKLNKLYLLLVFITWYSLNSNFNKLFTIFIIYEYITFYRK